MNYIFNVVLLVYKIVQAPCKTSKMYYGTERWQLKLKISYGTMYEKAAEELHRYKQLLKDHQSWINT